MTLVNKLETVKDYLNGEGSEEFLGYYAAEHYTGYIMLVEDDETASLKLENGKITEIFEGKPDAPEDSYIGLGGPGHVWDYFKKYYQRSMQYVNEHNADEKDWKVYGPKLMNRQYNTVLSHIGRIYSYVRDGDEIYSDHIDRDADKPLEEELDFVRGFYVNVNGTKIYVETNDGPTENGVIIAMHTAGRESRQYHDIMRILKDKYRVYAPDGPGHGKSMPLDDNKVVHDYEEYGKWMWDITQALNVDNPVYIGCSMAGQLVYHMAIEYPDAVKGVVCIQGTHSTPLADTLDMIPLLTHPANNLAYTQRDYSDSMIGRKTSSKRRDFIRWGVEIETSVLKRGDYDVAFNNDLTDQMGDITCPVRVIQGTDDTLFTVAMSESSMEVLTGTDDKELHLIDGYGHFMVVENPEVVSEIIDELMVSINN